MFLRVVRETACLKKFTTFPRDCQQGIFRGPGCYHPSHKAKLSVLQEFLKIYRDIIPHSKGIAGDIIWHNDLHTDNIFVDPDNPSQITSIIDWQCVPIYPTFLVAHHPSLIEYDGPKLDGFIQPKLPENFDSLDLDPEAKKVCQRYICCPVIFGFPMRLRYRGLYLSSYRHSALRIRYQAKYWEGSDLSTMTYNHMCKACLQI
ncbi:kinase-like domain-containing protein [Penicillium capsulatum]|uniref:Altered inheritance of mitochondria protein 9, mitochondrial n=1 Tax=Penicillium capsulatum TaxID=69766 RepID=A0A9W9I298_9EURO|nr:kinase-like domain-containing protein [Penicillium capsulatum]KAJ6117278.1 kinase-like domain-containing protein [Penicillium capsulatum]